jgi:hypothetical protein
MLASYNNAVSGKKHSGTQKCARYNKSDESKKLMRKTFALTYYSP